MTTTAKGLFGLKIPAGGAIIPLDIPWDVRITNIAFGEEVEGSARSVIKVHRARLPDYSDDEFDEFDDDEDDDEDDEEDDEDDEDAADAEEATQAVNGKKASKKTAEDDGVEGEEDDDEEEDDEDDEDSEDEDEDEQWIEEDFVICSLYPKQNEQAVVDLAFCVDEEIGFSVSGDNDVELTGYYVAPDPLDIGSDSEYDEFDEYDEDDEDDLDSDELEALYDELEEEEDEETDEDMDDDIQIEELDAAAKAVPAVKSIKAANSKKRTNEEVEEADDSVADAAAGAVSQLSKNQRKKLNKKLKTEADANTSVEKVEAAAKDTKDGKAKVKTAEKEVVKKEKKEKITTPSGLVIEDKVVGKGTQAKAGNRVSMRYVGRLTNGKQFDANMTGKPFSFKLGKGEVIAAWDEGIKGMQVGGQRRLTCPPKLAYGKAGAPPDIPSNSTLVFDVKLLEIK